MTLNVKNNHSVLHHKGTLFTVLDYSRNFGNSAKEGVKRTTHLATYYLTNPYSWYPVPEHAMILLVIPAIQLLTPVPMAPLSIQKMRDWALTTMARAGTFLSYLYQRN